MSIELTVQDQWVMRVLLHAGNMFVGERSIVAEAMDERPTLLPQDMVAAARKMLAAGYVERDEAGGYRPTRTGRKLKGIIPERPGVNIEYYG